jgi:hypothetical protein
MPGVMCPLSCWLPLSYRLSRSFSRPLRCLPLTAAFFVLALARPSHGAPAASPPAHTGAQAPATATQTRAPAAKPGAAEWLTDDQGRQYQLQAIPKSQGAKIGPDRVRTLWGVQADLVREDEQFFYIKLYKVGPAPAPDASTRPAPPPAPPEPLPPTSQRLRWTPYGTGLPTAGQWREGIALADMAGDGHLAIVVSPARKSLRAPSIFVRDGTTWARSKQFTFPDLAYDYGDVTVGDFDKDGVPDMVLGVHLRGVMALRGGKDGHFADASKGLPFITRADQPAFSSRAVLLADCNGDGRPDILALGEGPRLPTAEKSDYAVALGIGSYIQETDGTWTSKPMAERGQAFGSSMASGDLDGDGKVDLVIAPGVLGETKLLFRGDGACGWQAEAVDAVRPRSYITSVATAKVKAGAPDVLLLGYTDFAASEPFFGIDLLTRDAQGHWTRTALTRAPGRGRIEAITAGDLDGDGAVDLAAVTNDGDVHVLLGDGRGGFTREQQTLSSPGHCGGAAVAIGDLDGDGLADLVVGFSQEASPMTPNVCPSEGALIAWRTEKAAAGAAKPARRVPTQGAAPTPSRRPSAATTTGPPKPKP